MAPAAPKVGADSREPDGLMLRRMAMTVRTRLLTVLCLAVTGAAIGLLFVLLGPECNQADICVLDPDDPKRCLPGPCDDQGWPQEPFLSALAGLLLGAIYVALRRGETDHG